jgi:hypothetical protein
VSWTHPESTERKLRTSDALAIQLPSSSQQLIQLRDEFGFSEKWNPSDLYKSDESELEALFKRLKEIKKKS